MRISLSQTPFRALISGLSGALALAGAVLALTPVHAVAGQPAFATARLAAPLDGPRQAIVGEVLWKCAGDTCAAPHRGSRAVITCQQVAKKFGEVAAFTSPAGTLSEQDLAKCNAR